jgi:hypothetical protein
MAKRLYLDYETCGLYGLPVLLQYKVEGGEIILYEIWKHPIGETLDLIEWMMEHCIVGYNLVFDHFHTVKTYTVFRQFPRHLVPENIIDDIGEAEAAGRDGPCVKPASALDLLLYSRKGPYQSFMAREDIRIRRVPTVLAYDLRDELESRVEIDGIYFARRHDPTAPKWSVYDIPNAERTGINPDFKDVVLKFHPAGGLKFLAEYALGIKDTVHFSEIELDKQHSPTELGYAPFCTAISKRETGWAVFDADGIVRGHTWPAKIRRHIEHWHSNERAREYARKDVLYTEALDRHWGFPEPGDDDSVLACMVAAVRWHGFRIDIEGLQALRAAAAKRAEGKPLAPGETRAYLREVMDEMEYTTTIRESTSKVKLEEIASWQCDCTFSASGTVQRADSSCTVCGGTGKHPAALRAAEVLDARKAVKECELYDKLLTAGRFHASLNVIGTLSSRMSGADGLNPQGIKREAWVRNRFPMAWDDYKLCGGDFSSFEVTLADACYNDPQLRQDLLSGRKIHAEMAAFLYGYTYDEIVKGVKAEAAAAAKAEGMGPTGSKFTTMYTNGKQAVFALIYGGDYGTISRKLGVDAATAEKAYNSFMARYPMIAVARKKIFDMFCSMRQEGGIGTPITWSEPADYVESLLGFRRYFTLENKICSVLYHLAQNLPDKFRKNNTTVIRRDRVQTAGGATASAIYGAAFQIQAAAMRAAANHVIQSTGAEITKRVERKIWDLQPAGVSEWRVAPLNIHDEILSVTHPDYVDEVDRIVKETVESYRPKVPLIGMSWGKDLKSWADTH